MKLLTDINDMYVIYPDAKIWNRKVNRVMTPRIEKNGYLSIALRDGVGGRKQYSLHRLVAKAFIPNHNNKKEVNHIDGNKLNNNVENLEWCTRAENIQHSYLTGLRSGVNKGNFKKSYYNSKSILLTNLDSGKELGFFSIKDCARSFGVGKSVIQKALKRGRYKGWNIKINSNK